jgi:hypothetical protein
MKTKALLESLSPADLHDASGQRQHHKPITNPAVIDLLKFISRIGVTAAGSDEKRSYMLIELKSSIVYWGCPIIYMTLNPGDLHSPLALFYAGEPIDIKSFVPEWLNSTYRVKVLERNPLAVVQYFHNTVNTIIENVLRKGMFGELSHHYGTIEYQGRRTPHLHIAVRYSFCDIN